MKEDLEKALRKYNAIIKTQPPFENKTPEDWSAETEAILEQSDIRGTDHFIEEELFTMQKSKVAATNELHAILKKIDQGEDLARQADELDVTYTGTLFALAASDTFPEGKFITAGDIAIAPFWGVNLHLDKNTVPRAVRKLYAIERAKRSIGFMADAQIAHDEIHSDQARTELQDIYAKRFNEITGHAQPETGHLMEWLAKSILKRLAIDCDLGIRVLDSDAHEDIEGSIDFYVQKRNSQKKTGIQFTTSTNEENFSKKLRRAAISTRLRPELDRVAVVRIRFDGDPRTLLPKWAENAPYAFTPVDIVPVEIQEQICFNVLRIILPPLEFNEKMKTIHQYLGIYKRDIIGAKQIQTPDGNT